MEGSERGRALGAAEGGIRKMLDFLEAMGRLVVGILRLLDVLQGLIDFGCGIRWFFSPDYRAEVQAASGGRRFRIYSGVFLVGAAAVGVLFLLGMMLKPSLVG